METGEREVSDAERHTPQDANARTATRGKHGGHSAENEHASEYGSDHGRSREITGEQWRTSTRARQHCSRARRTINFQSVDGLLHDPLQRRHAVAPPADLDELEHVGRHALQLAGERDHVHW